MSQNVSLHIVIVVLNLSIKSSHLLALPLSLKLFFWCCKIMSQLKHVICPVCKKGILTVLAEVGVEAQGTTAMFQSLSAAQGRVYRCDNCGKSFVKVNDEFLELIY